MPAIRLSHCGSTMNRHSTVLARGGVQYVHTCHCGHQEHEVFSRTGQFLQWVNVSVKKALGESPKLAHHNDKAPATSQ